MSKELATTRGVNNYYGVRTTDEQRSSVQYVGGNKFTIEVAFRGADISLDAFVTLPAGANITSATLEVIDVFALAGTTPTVNLGTKGSAATNGFPITEAQIEAASVYDLTGALTGTWAAPLVAETIIDLELAGAGAALTADTGHAVIKVNYELIGA